MEVHDIDFRQLYGWHFLADQLRSLTIIRGQLDDPEDLLISIVQDDIEARRYRSSKPPARATPLWSSAPCIKPSDGCSKSKAIHEMRRTASESSASSILSGKHRPTTSRSSSNLLAKDAFSPTHWRALRHLCLADNGLDSISLTCLSVVSSTLISLDLSSNRFTALPEALATLPILRALNMSGCLVNDLSQLARSSLAAVESCNLRANELRSLMGIETLSSLQRLDLRENHLTDLAEVGRLTAITGVREIYVVGNPFTRTHSNYRVHIFNFFRGAAGYVEDIRIDGIGPSSKEKKQLKGRPVAPSDAGGLVTVTPTISEAQIVRHSSAAGRLAAPQPASLDSHKVNPRLSPQREVGTADSEGKLSV